MSTKRGPAKNVRGNRGPAAKTSRSRGGFRLRKGYTGGPNCRLCKMLNEGCGYLVDGSEICNFRPIRRKKAVKKG